MTELLSPTLDVVFKLLFIREDSKDLLISLINSVLQSPVPVRDITIKNPELPQNRPGDKGIFMDILAELDNGQFVDVEMQMLKKPALPERALFYWSRICNEQLQKGQGYDKLRPATVILFLDFNLFDDTPCHSIYRVLEEKTHRPFSNLLAIHTVEFPKLLKLDKKDRMLSLWSRFLVAKTEAELLELCKEEPLMEKAKSELERLSQDPKARMMARDREMGLADYRITMGAAYAEGLREGRLERLRELLLSRFGPGLPPFVEEKLNEAQDYDLKTWLDRIMDVKSLKELFGS